MPASTQIATVDLSPFLSTAPVTPSTATDRQQVARRLVAACHQHGFVNIRGHGLSREARQDAFGWVKRFFALDLDDKMKAPHPAGPIPHRGYSGISKEKVYSREDIGKHPVGANLEQELRKISDFKESFEIGSELDDFEQNIWIPESVLPMFRESMNALYERLFSLATTVLQALSLGLGLDQTEHDALMLFASSRHSQLRLLHYPAVSPAQVKTDLLARLPAHRDLSTFTMVFQEDQGGLEFLDQHSGEYVPAIPEEDTLVLNVGNMLQRFTNDHFVSAMHRVSITDDKRMQDAGLPARYSIPFFVLPDPASVLEPLPKFVTEQNRAKYEPIKLGEYRSQVMKYQYKS